MNVIRLFEKHPPLEPLVTLGALVRDWKWRTAPGGPLADRRDKVVAYCGDAPDLETAIIRACESRGPDGRKHPHQSKVSDEVLARFSRWLRVSGSFRLRLQTWQFDLLHDAIWDYRMPGIGVVTCYDIAVRIGAYMGIQPESLYLHAGVADGWSELTGQSRPGAQTVRRVSRPNWPVELRDMDADDVEDFVCTYRHVFQDLPRAKRRAAR